MILYVNFYTNTNPHRLRLADGREVPLQRDRTITAAHDTLAAAENDVRCGYRGLLYEYTLKVERGPSLRCTEIDLSHCRADHEALARREEVLRQGSG